MKRFGKSLGKLAAALCMAAMVLTACGGVTEEQLATRESAIAMMESGDYEGAVAAFNGLVKEAASVTEFELDILKYRAEAEFLLEDYEAALHTYRTLMEVDEERPEYCYMASMALSKAGQMHDAVLFLESGEALDKKLEAAGFFEATVALAEGYEAGGNLDAAKGIYQELIDGGRGNSDLYNRLMVMAMGEGNYEEALKMAAKGLILTDGLAVQELKFNEAVCYEYLGNFAKALELFRAYAAEFGSDERVEHEIAFLETR
ncbi:MAG: hypothetical protein IJ374_09875 [Lachnospiraceae bacterium]|nr:hypothetical protein [Lachnospiraceae bacterium]